MPGYVGSMEDERLGEFSGNSPDEYLRFLERLIVQWFATERDR